MKLAVPELDVEFRRDGRPHDSRQIRAVLRSVDTRVTDLLILCHGWNNDIGEARALYDALVRSTIDVLHSFEIATSRGRRARVVRVYWPSKRFANAASIAGGAAAFQGSRADEMALLRFLDAMKADPQRLGGTDSCAERIAVIERAQALVPALERSVGARAEFAAVIRSLIDRCETDTDDATAVFVDQSAEELFDRLQFPIAPSGAGPWTSAAAGRSARLGADPGLGFCAAARRIANFTTYYEMKVRAGHVGGTGLANMLRRIRAHRPELRLHLVGHSFGGRVVTAAANTLDANTKGVTLTLLQAAFSHNAFGVRFDGVHDGSFRSILSDRRVSGPILITHTKNDHAVGIAYPFASRVAGQNAAWLGTKADPYGGLGRNGAQHTPEAQAENLSKVGSPYQFRSGAVYNLRADGYIRHHNDVTGHAVAYAVVLGITAGDMH